MRSNRYSFLGIVGAAFFLLGVSGASAASSSIQMLPPVSSGTTPCASGSGSQILSWDGASAIRCSTDFFTDTTNNVTMRKNVTIGGIDTINGTDSSGNSLYIAGAIRFGASTTLNSTGVNTINNLANISCTSSQAITKDSNNNFSCVAIGTSGTGGGGGGTAGPQGPQGPQGASFSFPLTIQVYQDTKPWHYASSNNTWYADSTAATCPAGTIATGGNSVCQSYGGTRTTLFASIPGRDSSGRDTLTGSCANTGDPSGGPGITTFIFCASSPPPMYETKTVSAPWALNPSNGAYYANATTYCDVGYIAVGGGGDCQSAGGTKTTLFLSTPQGNNAWKASCSNIGTPYNTTGTSIGAVAYVYCVRNPN